jgi:hypothetical protein
LRVIVRKAALALIGGLSVACLPVAESGGADNMFEYYDHVALPVADKPDF